MLVTGVPTVGVAVTVACGVHTAARVVALELVRSTNYPNTYKRKPSRLTDTQRNVNPKIR